MTKPNRPDTFGAWLLVRRNDPTIGEFASRVIAWGTYPTGEDDWERWEQHVRVCAGSNDRSSMLNALRDAWNIYQLNKCKTGASYKA